MFSFNIDAILIVQWLIAVGLPLLVGVFTTRMTQSTAKVLILAFLTTLTSVLGEALRSWQAGQAYDVGTAVFTLVTALALAWGAYSNVWKPTGVAESVTANVGRTADKAA